MFRRKIHFALYAIQGAERAGATTSNAEMTQNQRARMKHATEVGKQTHVHCTLRKTLPASNGMWLSSPNDSVAEKRPCLACLPPNITPACLREYAVSRLRVHGHTRTADTRDVNSAERKLRKRERGMMEEWKRHLEGFDVDVSFLQVQQRSKVGYYRLCAHI